MNDFKITTPIEREGQRVLTTAQLAEAYGTTVDTINRNFNRNKDRYIKGKHFYRLTGEELKEFKKTSGQIDRQFKQAPILYLWTEKGALLHAKSLNTDKAWEVYEFLVDTYFRTREMNKYYNEQIYQKLEVLEQKIDTLEKSITENSYGTVQTLIPCFEIMYKKLNKLYNKLKK